MNETQFDYLYSFPTFIYSEHFKHLDNMGDVFFTHHLSYFDTILGPLFNKPNICLEIGTHYGASAVWFLETICKAPDSHLYMMDVTPLKGYTILENNLTPYKNYTYIVGESRDSFKGFNHNGETKEFLDFIYVDGNHGEKWVLEDAVNAFYCLKPGGIICFDDYLADPDDIGSVNVSYAVDSFAKCFKDDIEFIFQSQQIWFIKK